MENGKDEIKRKQKKKANRKSEHGNNNNNGNNNNSSSKKLLSHQPTRISRLERLLCTCSCDVGKKTSIIPYGYRMLSLVRILFNFISNSDIDKFKWQYYLNTVFEKVSI